MPTKLARKKTVKLNGAPKVFTAVFENGILKPLNKVSLPERKKLTVTVRTEENSIADQIYGLCKPQHLNASDLDKIIEYEDWL